jgi:hypothetical protein
VAQQSSPLPSGGMPAFDRSIQGTYDTRYYVPT